MTTTLRKLMGLLEAYDELHQLLLDDPGHRLLGYINEDFRASLPMMITALSDQLAAD